MFIRDLVSKELFLKLTSDAIRMWLGDVILLPFDSNRSSTSREFLGINRLSPGKLEVNQIVGCQGLFPFAVSFI